MLIIRKEFILFCTDRLSRGHRPIPERPGLDGAKGVQGEQLHRIEPPAGWRTSSPGSPTAPRRFRAPPRTSLKSHWPARSPPLDFSDVPLAGEETASKLLDVTLAREDDRPRVPDQAEDSRSPIHLLLRNKYFETSFCLVYR